MAAEKLRAKIVENVEVARGVYSMWLALPSIGQNSYAGQFVSLYSPDGSKLLPRPISICEVASDYSKLRLVYRILGKGTKDFSLMKAGDEIEVMGPLGNGFRLEDKKAILIGGGIGIPPMLELAKQLGCEKEIVLGYRDDIFLEDEFIPYGKVHISTEKVSKGFHGNVIQLIEEKGLKGDIIYACGPTPMLRAVKEYAEGHNIIAQLSLEERMACGIGACLACVCKTKEVDHHSNVKNKRICKEGPVFYIDEIEI